MAKYDISRKRQALKPHSKGLHSWDRESRSYHGDQRLNALLPTRHSTILFNQLHFHFNQCLLFKSHPTHTNPTVVFLLTVPRRFISCSSALFLRLWFICSICSVLPDSGSSCVSPLIFIPPANFVCGGILFSRCPSVCPSVCPSATLIFFLIISWKCSDGYSSTSVDTLISIRCTYIRENKGWDQCSWSYLYFYFFFFFFFFFFFP